MREFLSYVLESFRDATGWSRDNGYSHLNETANELLNFHSPRGLSVTLSSLATPHFSTAYNLGTIGAVDGSISYLYSSVPLTNVVAQSASIPLPTLLRSYRQLQHTPAPALTTDEAPPLSLEALFPFVAATAAAAPASTAALSHEYLVPAAERLAQLVHGARKLIDKPVLLCGRLYLPRSMLEAHMVKRLAPSVQLQLRAVSDAKLPNGGTVLGILQYDRGTYGVEGLASTDGGLLGVRGLYNFGDHEAVSEDEPAATAAGAASAAASGAAAERLHGGRFSAGGEVYYGTLNKSGGISVGARFATLPGHNGTPLTATMTINPLMGNISASYAVVAREYCSLATKFEFNVYSYESEWAVGMELWSKRRLAGLVARDVGLDEAEAEAAQDATDGPSVDTKLASPSLPLPPPPPPPRPASPPPFERSFEAKLAWRLDDPAPETASSTGPAASETTATTSDDEYQGVLKARLDQNLKVGLLWEGRIQSLLFSLGSVVDLNKLDQPFRTLGLEIQFSS